MTLPPGCLVLGRLGRPHLMQLQSSERSHQHPMPSLAHVLRGPFSLLSGDLCPMQPGSRVLRDVVSRSICRCLNLGPQSRLDTGPQTNRVESSAAQVFAHRFARATSSEVESQLVDWTGCLGPPNHCCLPFPLVRLSCFQTVQL